MSRAWLAVGLVLAGCSAGEAGEAGEAGDAGDRGRVAIDGGVAAPDAPVAFDGPSGEPDAGVDAAGPDVDAAGPAVDAREPDASEPDARADASCPECECRRADVTAVLTPRTSAPTPVGVAATFDLAVTNNDTGACAPTRFELRTRVSSPGIEATPTFSGPLDTGDLRPGATVHLSITAAATLPALAGASLAIAFDLSPPDSGLPSFEDRVVLNVAEPSGCHVSIRRELMITDVSVVDDPVRTGFADPADRRTGAWTFKRLVEELAPTPADAPAMVEAMLSSLTTAQTINGFVVAPRPTMRFFLDAWPRLPGGALDLRAAPFRLLAIVNRFDLRNLDRGDAGEARFIFGFTSPEEGVPLAGTIIFEYKLPAASELEALAWARAFHALGERPFSEEYNVALQALTERFTGRGARPGAPNGSALSALRTNEIAFGDGDWELRQFAISAATGRLEPRPVELTPDHGLIDSPALARYMAGNAAAILADQHIVPEQFEGQPFLGGAALNDGEVWRAPGIDDSQLRHHLALNTCSGCHLRETGTGFLHVRPRLAGSESTLSGFLLGNQVADPLTGERRTFADLERRRIDLDAIVCPEAALAPTTVSLRRGIVRVH